MIIGVSMRLCANYGCIKEDYVLVMGVSRRIL